MGGQGSGDRGSEEGGELTYYQFVRFWVLVIVGNTKEQEVFSCEDFTTAKKLVIKMVGHHVICGNRDEDIDFIPSVHSTSSRL